MATPTTNDTPATFGAVLLAARTAAKVSRAELAKHLDVLPRTVARWEADENYPGGTIIKLILVFLHETGRLPRPLIDEYAEVGHINLWTLGIDPPPTVPFVPTPAHQKAIDDAIREAAEELEIDPRKLRPVAGRLFAALAESGIPADVAAGMAVARAKKE
jgi:transcriptional regulator with XRE-family HTH domain